MNIKKQFVKDTKGYKVLNQRKSYIGTISAAALERSFRVEDSFVLERLSDRVKEEVPHDLLGGVIVFSTDVNAVELSKNKFLNKIKQFYNTWKHRITRQSKIDKVAVEHNIEAWSVGNFFKGKYKSETGKIFDEKSLAIEVIYIPLAELIELAESLCEEFKQECVLVKSYSTNKILFVDPN